MSNSSFQSEIPKARINLKLDLHTGGASKKTELPLKLLVAGDFSNGQESAPLSERKKVNLNKNNFDSVLSEYSPKVNLTVKNTLAGDGSEAGSNRTSDAEYVPFSSFRHKGGMMRSHAPPRYYHTRVKRGVTGLYDTWLILGGHQWEDDRLFEREAVSLQITGTNGQLPRRALQSTLLDRSEQVVSTPLSVRNLCKPTLPVYPPAEDRFHWRVLSHLGSGFLNMMSTAEVLRGTLALYNWQGDELNTRRLEAIQQVEHHRLQRFEQGYLLRGLDIEVTLDSNGFTGEGDIHLFGEMLNRFFALYADMNQFNQLTLIVQPEGKCIRWKENHSPRLPG